MKLLYLKFIRFSFVGILLGLISLISTGQNLTAKYDKYLSPKEINNVLIDLNKKFPNKTRLITLAESPGKFDLKLLEIGPETGKSKKSVPAVFVVANMEGTTPISSMGAIYLADMLLSSKSEKDPLTWYILTCGNPDALDRYFKGIKNMNAGNYHPKNDDMDDLVDEDDFNDLDGDGFITQMRVVDPSGTMVLVDGDPRMMRKADPIKGEKGIYKLYGEGLDDDGDGKYNEDGLGGVNVGINFPHLFKPFTPSSGLWPGCTDESYQLMKFVFEHPEIAMTFTLGSTNFCMVPPKGGRKAGVDMDKIKIPKRMAPQFNADPDRTYTMKEVMELVQAVVPPGMEVTEGMVASFLGLGAVVNPMDADLKFYKELTEKYKEYLKEKGVEGERLDPSKAKDGSFELWSYYHLGVPTFSMDFWTIPKVKEKKEEKSGLTVEGLEKMSSEDFLALGEDKVATFLKEIGAPDQFSAKTVIQMVEGGKTTPKQMAGMMKNMPKPKDEKEGDPKTKALLAYSDSQLGGKAFVDWKPYKHPVLGDVEIGGMVPYSDNTPKPEIMDSLLSTQVPWIVELTKKLPKLNILKTEVKPKGEGIFELNVWIGNESYLPFPTAMGQKNEQPAPAVVILKGEDFEIMSGKKRTPVSSLPGLQSKKLSWLLKSEKKSEVDVELAAVNAWGTSKNVKIGGTK